MLHASPDWSTAHLEDDRDAVADQLVAAFFEALRLPPVVLAYQQPHRWRYALARTPRTEGCLWDERLRLGVCGDWLHGSRVEGAYLSGRAAGLTVA